MPVDEPLMFAITVPVVTVVTLCAITDILEHRIYNSVLLPTLLLAFFFNTLFGRLPGLLDCVLGLALGMAILFPLYFLRGTSAGDVKLLGVVGALLGTQGALIAGVATLCFGGVFGVLFIVWRLVEPALISRIAQITGPGGPAGRPVIDATSDDTAWKAVFPYAPAIACGTYYALWHLGYFSQVLG